MEEVADDVDLDAAHEGFGLDLGDLGLSATHQDCSPGA
jgi:hypothetical protein